MPPFLSQDIHVLSEVGRMVGRLEAAMDQLSRVVDASTSELRADQKVTRKMVADLTNEVHRHGQLIGALDRRISHVNESATEAKKHASDIKAEVAERDAAIQRHVEVAISGLSSGITTVETQVTNVHNGMCQVEASVHAGMKQMEEKVADVDAIVKANLTATVSQDAELSKQTSMLSRIKSSRLSVAAFLGTAGAYFVLEILKALEILRPIAPHIAPH